MLSSDERAGALARRSDQMLRTTFGSATAARFAALCASRTARNPNRATMSEVQSNNGHLPSNKIERTIMDAVDGFEDDDGRVVGAGAFRATPDGPEKIAFAPEARNTGPKGVIADARQHKARAQLQRTADAVRREEMLRARQVKVAPHAAAEASEDDESEDEEDDDEESMMDESDVSDSEMMAGRDSVGFSELGDDVPLEDGDDIEVKGDDVMALLEEVDGEDARKERDAHRKAGRTDARRAELQLRLRALDLLERCGGDDEALRAVDAVFERHGVDTRPDVWVESTDVPYGRA